MSLKNVYHIITCVEEKWITPLCVWRRENVLFQVSYQHSYVLWKLSELYAQAHNRDFLLFIYYSQTERTLDGYYGGNHITTHVMKPSQCSLFCVNKDDI